MKDNFREKLQAIYGEPPEELENLIHWQILSLPDSEGGKITMKKPIKFRIAIAIANFEWGSWLSRMLLQIGST
jgi:hypothetical protein